jgi:hypothetical protein
MKILIFIDHDIVVRHFLHSQVFCELMSEHNVVFVLPEPGNKRIHATEGEFMVPDSALRRLPIDVKRQSIWQKLTVTDMLRYRPGAHHAAMRQFHRTTGGWKAAVIYSLLGLPAIYTVFRWASRWRLKNNRNQAMDALLEVEAPDLIIHPSVLAGLFINELVESCREREIPLLVIMNSWDNPSTKRAMTGNPDWLLVWGPQTRAHAIKYMQMPPERVINFGAAQFDLYRKPPRISRAEFAQKHGIPTEANILLYAGSSKDTDEYSHLRQLNDAIARGDLGNTVVVYRPHPWGGGGKEGHRIATTQWPHVRIEFSTRSYIEQVSQGNRSSITTPDYKETHDVLCAIDALISPLSTIVIEGALHGKPVLCFLPDEENEKGHYKLVLPLTHFEDFFSNPDFRFAAGDLNLIPAAQALLSFIGDIEYQKKLRSACEHFVSGFDRPYGQRLVEFVATVNQGRNA